MHASLIWYRARPTDELEQRLAAMLASVKADISEENMTINAEQIPTLLAAAMRSTDIAVIVGGMDLRRDEENIIFLAAKCLRVPLERGRQSRSRFMYDPMRGAPLPSFETAVLFPSASGGAEGAVLVKEPQTVILLPRLDAKNADMLELIGEYLPMLIGLPEEPEPEEEPQGEGWRADWEGMRAENIPDYYDENGKLLPKYISRVLARKEKLNIDRGREITGAEIYHLFRDEEAEPTEDNLMDASAEPTEGEKEHTRRREPKKSTWEQLFDESVHRERLTEAERREQRIRERAELETEPSAEKRPRFRAAQAGTPRPARLRQPAGQEGETAPARAGTGGLWGEEERPSRLAAKRAARVEQRSETDVQAAADRWELSLEPGEDNLAPAEDAREKTAVKAPLRRAVTSAVRVAALMLITSVIVLVCYLAVNSYRPGVIEKKELYQSDLAALYTDGEERGSLPYGAYSRFAKLYEQNNDVSGFISIPGTDIAQPVMRAYSSSPDFYRSYSFSGAPDERGSLYFDCNNVIEWGSSNYNLVIYGSAPSDGSMFTGLRSYMDKEFLQEHPMINMDTLYEEGKWIVFGVDVVSGDTVDEFNYHDTEFVAPYSRQIYLYNLYIRSMYYTNTEVLPDDPILTLITDSDVFTGAKLLICARKVREGEDLSSVGRYVIENENVMMPDLWYELYGSEMPTVPQLELPTEDYSYAYTTAATYETTTTTAATTTAATTATVTTGTAATTLPTEGTLPVDEGYTTTTTATTTGTNPTTLPASSAQNMRITSAGKVVEGKAEDVLAMIVEAEIGASGNIEALKAQAVAAYTYYLYAGGSAKAPAFPTKEPNPLAKQAALEVLGQYMTYGGAVPYTPYYDTSAGMTAANADMNGTELAWLVPVDCSVDEDSSAYRTVKRMTPTEVAAKVKDAKGIDLTKIADKSEWFEVLERDVNDLYVKQVRVGEKTYRGNTLHLSILGYSFLRSPCFWIEYDETEDIFIFTSLGYGTGVGMSQTGADRYAALGYNYVWILQHFYPGVTIKSK